MRCALSCTCMSLWASERASGRVSECVCDVHVKERYLSGMGWVVGIIFPQLFFSVSLFLSLFFSSFVLFLPCLLYPFKQIVLSVENYRQMVFSYVFCYCFCLLLLLHILVVLFLGFTNYKIENESVFSACVACINLKYKNKRWTTTSNDSKRERMWKREKAKERHGTGKCMHVGVATASQSACVELRLQYFCLESKKCWPFYESALFFTLNIHIELFQIDYLRIMLILEIQEKIQTTDDHEIWFFV